MKIRIIILAMLFLLAGCGASKTAPEISNPQAEKPLTDEKATSAPEMDLGEDLIPPPPPPAPPVLEN